jgi:ubiquinone/menaquinone biosynthesis C-methylase UbiE
MTEMPTPAWKRRRNRMGVAPRSFEDVDRAAAPAALVRMLDTNAPHWREVRERIDAALDLGAGDRVLDVGCGTGEQVRAMAARVGPAGRAVGLDRSATMLAEARARGRGARAPAEYRPGDVYALPFPDDAFDACLAEKLFTHLADPARALAEMRRVTRAGGRVAVASGDMGTLVVDAPDRALTRRILNHCCDTWLVNGWVGRQLTRLFRQAGLADVAVWPISTVATDLARGAGALDFRALAERARAAGVVSAEEAARWSGELQEASRDGHFFSAFTVFVVSGREP